MWSKGPWHTSDPATGHSAERYSCSQWDSDSCIAILAPACLCHTNNVHSRYKWTLLPFFQNNKKSPRYTIFKYVGLCNTGTSVAGGDSSKARLLYRNAEHSPAWFVNLTFQQGSSSEGTHLASSARKGETPYERVSVFSDRYQSCHQWPVWHEPSCHRQHVTNGLSLAKL